MFQSNSVDNKKVEIVQRPQLSVKDFLKNLGIKTVNNSALYT